MTLPEALADVAAARAPFLDATRSKPLPEQQAVCDGPLGAQYRAAVTAAERLWRDEEWAREYQARSAVTIAGRPPER